MLPPEVLMLVAILRGVVNLKLMLRPLFQFQLNDPRCLAVATTALPSCRMDMS